MRGRLTGAASLRPEPSARIRGLFTKAAGLCPASACLEAAGRKRRVCGAAVRSASSDALPCPDLPRLPPLQEGKAAGTEDGLFDGHFASSVPARRSRSSGRAFRGAAPVRRQSVVPSGFDDVQRICHGERDADGGKGDYDDHPVFPDKRPESGGGLDRLGLTLLRRIGFLCNQSGMRERGPVLFSGQPCAECTGRLLPCIIRTGGHRGTLLSRDQSAGACRIGCQSRKNGVKASVCDA